MVRKIWDIYGVPVNVIVSDERVESGWSTTGQSVAEALDSLVAQVGGYRWRMIMGRYVLYPSDPVWDSNVSEITIVGVPRFDAATQYLAAVRRQIPALDDLVGALLRGDPRAPAYAEPVSLNRESSIVAHLVEVLGTNDQLAFIIERALSGKRVLHFQQVPPRQTSRSTS